MEFAKELISQYGYIAVFLLLALGIIGLPVPDEILMTFVGYLTSVAILNYELAIATSFFGAITGMTISYTIGRKIGKPFIERHGKWLGLNKLRLKRVEKWFNQYGPWTIVVGYFIPGIRHLTCYFSGISGMCVRRYLVFTCSGAFAWCLIFVTIGYYIGELH